MRHYWGELTTTDFDRLAGQNPVAAMVLGAVEQHGPHLPLATDRIIGEGLLDAASARLKNDFPLLILPPLSLGASEEHADFAGTLSLSADQLKRQVMAVGEGLARAGLERLVLVNAHGGNIGWMNDAALELRRLNLLAVKASYMQFEPPTDLLAAAELRDGLHGGLAETAMMRHLAPELVRMDRARDFEPNYPQRGPLAPQGEAAWAWLARDLHPAGVVGDAASANPELGERLVGHYAERLAQVIEASRDLEWPPERSKAT
ncbi:MULTISPECIES: creatininase family protein [unclassified Wenzhouxiangella]|uniref:creatininase family protein n=1 Tax=unclassified Wenzhouxiangella TaxID=2613841 RepID=UPI000E328417|nr:MULTISPECIES: creatininase family protein [unclassified Wenzhouxiangella]RFF27507.1 creatininase family protein [Wenzhouxiangella sp. 15181]RFP69631.1 creatininase family protein [Wenzhouxiangella sp. 15190]